MSHEDPQAKFNTLLAALLSQRHWNLTFEHGFPHVLAQLVFSFTWRVYDSRLSEECKSPHIILSDDGMRATCDPGGGKEGGTVAMEDALLPGDVVHMQIVYARDGRREKEIRVLGSCYFTGVIAGSNVSSLIESGEEGWTTCPAHGPEFYGGAFGLDDYGDYYYQGKRSYKWCGRTLRSTPFKSNLAICMTFDWADAASAPTLRFNVEQSGNPDPVILELPAREQQWYPAFTPFNISYHCTVKYLPQHQTYTTDESEATLTM